MASAAKKDKGAREGVRFVPVELERDDGELVPVTRVELALAERDENVVVEGEYVADDPAVVRALEAHPLVRRAEA